MRGFSATESVDGVADTWDQQLAGNWNQLRKLKQRLPNLRILISVGGWSWSTHFSAASKTDELRKQLVGSCVELFIRGNVPGTDGRGGEGAAWGVFDGIDIDWEYPTGGGEAPGAPEDTVNYNLLLEEFRRQLDYVAYGVKRPYLLTVAVGSSKWQVDKTQPAVYSQSLDFINVMTYDLQGSWSGVGPTDFHCAHYADPSSPFYTWGPDLNLNHSISYFMSKGVPAEKLVAGIAFYGYGWTGVNMTKNNGTYQPSTAWAPGTYQTGTDDWNAIKLKNGTLAIHPVTGGAYKFSNITKQWWTFDSPQSITNKASWAKGKGLRGLFSWALSGDTAEGELVGKMALVK